MKDSLMYRQEFYINGQWVKPAGGEVLMGTLRWREEINVFASVTGATSDSINGAVFVP